MIALIGNQFYELAPVTAPDGDFTITVGPNDTLRVYKGTKHLEYGVLFYSQSKWADIESITGKITRNSSKPAHFRAVIGDFHLDLTA